MSSYLKGLTDLTFIRRVVNVGVEIAFKPASLETPASSKTFILRPDEKIFAVDGKVILKLFVLASRTA